MKRVAFSLLSAIILVLMVLPVASPLVIASEGEEVDQIVISPDDAVIQGDGEGTQAYTAEAFDAQGASLGDVTADTTFTIEPEAGGSWEDNVYTSLYGGSWTVTGTHISGKTDTATLHVIESRAQPEDDYASPDESYLSPITALLIPTAPYLEVDKWITPDTVCVGEEAEITLEVTGAGGPVRVPLDVVLVMDRSGSVSAQQLADAQAAAKYFISLLDSAIDRVGLVSYSGGSPFGGYGDTTLDEPLTSVFADVEAEIDALSASGATNIGSGIDLATEELINNGRTDPNVVKVEILIGDGGPNFMYPEFVPGPPWYGPGSGFWEPAAQYARDKAAEAVAEGFTLHTVALTTVPFQLEFLDDQAAGDHSLYGFDGLAYVGGGTSYPEPSNANMLALFNAIGYSPSGVAAENVVVTEVLPAGVNYVGGSANITPDSIVGQTLTWNLGTINIGDTVTITFSVTFDNAGYQLADVHPDTRVDYDDYLGDPASAVFPLTYITVCDVPTATAVDVTLCPDDDLETVARAAGAGCSCGDCPCSVDSITDNLDGTYTVTCTNECGTDTADGNITIPDCDDLDYYGAWEYYCNDGQVWRHRMFHDFDCEGGECIEVDSYYTDNEFVTDCDDGDPCTLDWCEDGTCHHRYICGPGPGPRAPDECFFRVDMLGELYQIQIDCCRNKSLEYCRTLDPDELHFMEIEEGMEVICGDCDGCWCYPKVIVVSLAEESPTPPDGTVVVGSVYYDFTGYKDTLRLYECDDATYFYPALSILIHFDPETMPDGAYEPYIAWYDAELGVWNPLPFDPDRLAGADYVTGETNILASTFAILANVPPAEAPPETPPPAPTPAHFVVSNLSITPAESKVEEIVTISVDVTNDGEQEGTYLVELVINGQKEEDEEVTLGAGQSEEVTFAVSAASAGQYEVVISGLSGEFTVVGAINWWLWGSIIAVVVLFIAWLIWYRQRRMGAEPAP